MAYGITSESQLIDLKTIEAGCKQYKEAVTDIVRSGIMVREAGETCNQKALSVDEKSLEPAITQIGEDLISLKTALQNYADQVIAEATQVYNAQLEELKAYQESLKKNN